MVDTKRDAEYLEFIARNIQGFPYICADSSQILGGWLKKKHKIKLVYGVFNIDDLENIDDYPCIPDHWWIELPNGDILDYTYPQFYYSYEFREDELVGDYLYYIMFQSNRLQPLVKKDTYIWRKFIPLTYHNVHKIYIDIANESRTFQSYLGNLIRYRNMKMRRR